MRKQLFLRPRALAIGLACAFAVVHSGCNALTCGPGTEQKVDPQTGEPECVAPSASGVPCDVDGGARLVGGVCQGDPSRYPTCGPGTTLDPSSGSCVPEQAGAATPRPCPTPPSGKFCVNGVVRNFKDLSETGGKTFEVRAYNPLQFLSNPAVAPVAVVQTDASGTYLFPALEDDSGAGLIAIAVIDPAGPGGDGDHQYVLSGSGQDMLQAGAHYQVDLYAIEKSLVASWEQQAGLSAGTLLATGTYVARFLDKPRATPDGALPATGVVLTAGAMPAMGTIYFKGDLQHVDATLTATDATGAALLPIRTPLATYSGSGGNHTWESFLGGSAAGVVFVQNFYVAP